jgi:hypothetical protein
MLQSADLAPPAPVAPVTPPTPPTPRVIVNGQDRTLDVIPGAHEVLMALQAQRDELRDQLNTLEHKREEITEQIRENRSQGLDISGLETRVKSIDGRIAGLEQNIALADKAVADQAAQPGAVVPDVPETFHRDGPPEGFFVLGGFFIVLVMMPIALAFARRLWKRGMHAAPALAPDLGDRLRKIEDAVESVAVEVERIGEGQRFMSRVFTDRAGGAPDPRALVEGAAPAIDVAQRHKVAEPR